MKTTIATFLCVGLCCWCSLAPAHDTWIEAGPLVQRAGEYCYVDLMLGNHGNEHRDFKLASKITLAPCTLEARRPSLKVVDLKPAIIDMGSAEKEGYWTARYRLDEPGVHELVHTLDTLHGTIRAIKSAKTFIVALPRSGNVADLTSDNNRSHGFGLELVLQTPLSRLAAKEELRIQVLRSGKPLPEARVTFVPRGAQLASGFDEDHERISDSSGIVRYTPDQGNVILAIVHHVEPDEKGEGYERTHYSAAMVLPVCNRPLP